MTEDSRDSLQHCGLKPFACVQLLSLLRDYDVEWPALTLSMLSYSDTFNVGVSIVAPACFIQSWNFYTLYISTIAEPVRTSTCLIHTVSASAMWLASVIQAD